MHPLSAPPAPAARWLAYMRIHHQVVFALDHLRDPCVPLQLGACTFLRLSTAALRSYSTLTAGECSSGSTLASYPTLISALAAHDPEWWNRCHLSATGFLMSEDLIIAHSLLPLNQFVRRILQGQAAHLFCDRGESLVS